MKVIPGSSFTGELEPNVVELIEGLLKLEHLRLGKVTLLLHKLHRRQVELNGVLPLLLTSSRQILVALIEN